jgi:ParB-like chromosome segregation protein Spo0J
VVRACRPERAAARRPESPKGGAIMTTIKCGATTYEVHPAADLFPMLGNEELSVVANDIKRRGLLEPISRDKAGLILDGRNRLAACHKAGAQPRFVEVVVDDPAAFVISRNIFRRHLTPAQKCDLLMKLIAMQPEKSNRQIAKTAGVNRKAVDRARAKAEDVGQVAHVEKRTDTKGRKQSAAKAAATRQKNRDEKKAATKEREKARRPFLEPWVTKARELYVAAVSDLESHGFGTSDDTLWLSHAMKEEIWGAWCDLEVLEDDDEPVTGSAEISEDECRAEMEKLAKAES